MSWTGEATFDYLLVGGGLGSSLIALALFDAQPMARVGLVEQHGSLGGNHVWCFHAGDVDAAEQAFVAPLVSASWPRYEVRFPALSRTLEEPYAAVRSEQLDRVVREAFARRAGSQLFLQQRAVDVRADRVVLEDGRELRASIVIASRGPEAFDTGGGGGFQKFLGLELKLKRPSPIDHPVLMDARVPQRDGFRFLYALPFGADRVLLEDTYFSESPALDRERLESEIIGYAEQNGFSIDYVAREEVGVLPLPTRLRQSVVAEGQPLIAGYQGGWFHPVTGYSFPVAVRLASAVARAKPSELRAGVWPALMRQQRSQLRFCLFLNRLFFGAFAPSERRNVIERFYRLPPAAVRRFYAMRTTHADRARILCGRPPRGFSLMRALSTPPANLQPSPEVPSS